MVTDATLLPLPNQFAFIDEDTLNHCRTVPGRGFSVSNNIVRRLVATIDHYRGAPQDIKAKAATRFWMQVDRRGPDECWGWKGNCCPRGYGSFSLEGRNRRATHVSLMLDGRPSPEKGLFALHSCDNPNYVNPAHLRWGTMTDNMRDCLERHPHWGKKTHCKNGRPLSGDNLIEHRSTRARRCRICAKESHRRRMMAAAGDVA